MDKLQNISISALVVSIIAVILSYLTNMKVEAPHPDGNSTTMDISYIYGEAAVIFNKIEPYGIWGIIISFVALIFIRYYRRSY
ncbi:MULTISPECIES: hypothetical protein [Niallia]|jgi:hypothetical protein|uniref:Uncharacterized protein n=1 Tax=Niallia taxi TaxID=2499688 RepID=A0A3S2UE03_9BACI|nr:MULTISPECIES: hypothetical protein [Niallia]MDK8642475.1 hypothetical protein [Niallia taxi]MED4040547.1 hypothetical protein [Niallia taxi]MED4056987.1 hypothetical protein [Niallia taxi]MED4121667.1 hypothetical protein [Niallia taxi]RVT59503.1 hypothetical protein EM808_19610 [Niallia taxi]